MHMPMRRPRCRDSSAQHGTQPMRDAVITADLDQLLARIHEVEIHDPRPARALRRLAEQFEYQKLLDLFGPGVDSASPVSRGFPDGSAVLA